MSGITKPNSPLSPISSSIIQSVKSVTHIACAYFIFDSRDSRNVLQSFDGMLRSIAYQLTCHFDQMPEAILSIYKDHGSGTTAPSHDSLRKIISLSLGCIPETAIIIDAADESVDRDQVLGWLKALTSTPEAHRKAHILVTSRDEIDIRRHLQAFNTIYVHDHTRPDIESHINSTIANNGLDSFNEATLTKIRDTLLRDVGGM